MALLKNVFDVFGYIEKEKQIALIKLAAYRGCFDESYKNKIVPDEIAETLLSTQFENLEIGINWWVDTIDKKWLRSSFHQEGIAKGKDPDINVERWRIEAKSAESNEEYQLLALFKTLDLVDPVPIPEEKVSHVVIHGGIEVYAKARVNFIRDFTGKLYYVSSPRGLFNDEPSLAPILASWFGKPESASVIQSVLNKHKNLKTSNKNWLRDLDGLKQEIIEAIGETAWPMGKGWYYKNPAPFDHNARAEGRQSLAGWPTAMDMIEYLIEQRRKREPENFNNIELNPVYSVRLGRVANTEDNAEDWYREYGQHLPSDEKVVFVSNNSEGLHYIHFQNEMVVNKLNDIAKEKNFNITTVGPGAKKISLSAATDVFAKIFFSKRPSVLKQVKVAAAALLNTKLIERVRVSEEFDEKKSKKASFQKKMVFIGAAALGVITLFRLASRPSVTPIVSTAKLGH